VSCCQHRTSIFHQPPIVDNSTDSDIQSKIGAHRLSKMSCFRCCLISAFLILAVVPFRGHNNWSMVRLHQKLVGIRLTYCEIQSCTSHRSLCGKICLSSCNVIHFELSAFPYMNAYSIHVAYFEKHIFHGTRSYVKFSNFRS
jgi:hypothetical protein